MMMMILAMIGVMGILGSLAVAGIYD